MSQKEDVLFCKIAISNGLVSEADAQKVLALCDKREREAGSRPLIGALFSKYNLLKQPDVAKVYEAVKKRTGVAVGPARPASGVRKLGSASRGAVSRRRGEPAVDRPAKPIDPATLWMGIGGIVVFIAILCTMLYLVLKKDISNTPIVTTQASGSNVPAASATPKEPPRKAAPAVKPPPSADLPKEEMLEVKQIIMDARGMGSDKPEVGLKLLEGKKKALETKGRIPPKDLLDAIQEFQGKVKQAVAGGGAADTPPAEATAAAPKPAAEAPAPTKTEEPANNSDVDDLLKEK